VHGLTRALFRADLDRHWASFKAYDVPQAAVSRPAQAPGERGG
jgi:FAD-dependent urate hydroxylase